jgi:CDP-glucose 4,6-dehydratase
MMVDLRTSYHNKRVLVTGHTGFKGSWMSLWLEQLGAEVFGFSLEPNTVTNMFDLCGVKKYIDHAIGDIRDFTKLKSRVLDVKPDVIFHLAAQPLVRRSYSDPLETLAINIIGTANLLEAVRSMDKPCVVIIVSSDKCYENREWIWGYRENDPMGGRDPYSMSKGATELVTSCWRESYFNSGDKVKLASVRAGNVIGGGDWATDRIVPDCIMAFVEQRSVVLRHPQATRPWQHVLEPLGGYLLLGSKMLGTNGANFCSAWNFGPAAKNVVSVQNIVSKLAQQWGSEVKWSIAQGEHVYEAQLLALNCDKAIHQLGWQQTWDISEVVKLTIAWYRAWHEKPEKMLEVSLGQIKSFESALVQNQVTDH